MKGEHLYPTNVWNSMNNDFAMATSIKAEARLCEW